MDERAAGFRIRRFDEPDERRELELGSLELLRAGSLTLGRARTSLATTARCSATSRTSRSTSSAARTTRGSSS
jgi:hypothetical protein